jgi:hypothetical protein
MSILDLSDQPAWYAVRVQVEHYGTKGYLGRQYQWSKPKLLSNMDALKYAYDLQPNTMSKSGITAFYKAELYQWNGTQWVRIPG